MITFILGGARSGKSRHAQQLTEAAASGRVLIATAQALDDEMAARIQRHIEDRDESWTTIEEPLNICDRLLRGIDQNHAVLVDCLTLWLSNLMHAGLDVDADTKRLVQTLEKVSHPLTLVSNEVGMGIVPASRIGRDFRDLQGQLNQAVAAVCDRVEFVAAGIPLTLKG